MSDTSGIAAAKPDSRGHAGGTRRPAATGSGISTQVALGGLRRSIVSIGDVVKFALHVLRELPTAARLYPSEVFRHAGVLIRANTLIVLFMCFMLGAVMSITVHHAFNTVGIGSYVGAEAAVTNLRGLLHVVFGWIFAAKVGCGIVAELGAMRISEEVDAMEVMGIRSLAYLVGTRVLAGLIVVPFLWVAALATSFITQYAFNVQMLNTLSPGGYIENLFLFQNVRDLLFSLTWGTVLALIIVIVGCYFGYTAKGGAIGVGRNTAQSMLVNLVLISGSAMIFYNLFYGIDINAPIGN